MRKQILTAVLLAGCSAGTAGTAAIAADGAPSTTIGGRTFIDFTNISQQSNGVDTSASGTGLDVKRAYFIVDHTFDGIWSADLTTDFRYTSGDTDLYVKKAYIQARINDALVVRAGAEDTPWVPFVENLYGYRYIENTLIDRLKYGTSSDWGLSASGKLDGGLFQYSLSALNGAGYKTPTRSKTVDFEGRIGVVPLAGLTLAAGFYDGHRGQETAANPAENTATRWDAAVDYHHGLLNVGAEYFDARKWNQVQLTAPQPADQAQGESVWASVDMTAQWAVFARYDTAKPSRTLAAALKDEYFNVGVAFRPRKGLDLALVYKNERVDDGSISTSNGTVGGVNALTGGRYGEVGIWSQLSF